MQRIISGILLAVCVGVAPAATMNAAVAATASTSAAAAAPTPSPTPSQTASQAGGVRITNAKLQPVAAAGALPAQVRGIVDREVGPAWIGYTQSVNDARHVGCCWDGNGDNGRNGGCCGGCPLEERSVTVTGQPGATTGGSAAGPIKLEGATEFLVMLRVEQKRIERVRVFSADCELDAGGLPVTLVTSVRAADSIALLESVIAGWPATGRKGITDSAVMAIALHKDAAADAALLRLLAPAQSESVRKKALFWSAQTRGRPGFELVRRMMRDDPSLDVRKHAVFALTQSREPEVVPVLVETARSNPDGEVRGQALFWLAQRASKEAGTAITRAIADDPDTKVKERAVFALSQLPKEEGVPLLINVAKTTGNPAVRKKAMFWLGQSKDPRALEFFASILK
jgi:HEAT repeat protein